MVALATEEDEHVIPGSVLTADDLPTLRRLVAHFTERARHRRFVRHIACLTVAKVCARTIDVIERHGAAHPAINYSQRRNT